MAGVKRIAGVAKIAISPDLRWFKRDLDRQVREHLRDYEIRVRPDRSQFDSDFAKIEKDLREKLGDDAGLIKIGVDEDSHQEAIRQLRELRKEKERLARKEKQDEERRAREHERDTRKALERSQREQEKADRVAEQARERSAEKAARNKKIQDKTADLKSGYTPDITDLKVNSKAVQAEIKAMGKANSRAAKKARDDWKDAAKAADRVEKDNRLARRAEDNAAEALGKAQRNLAAGLADDADDTKLSNLQATLRQAQNSLDSATERRRQSDQDTLNSLYKLSQAEQDAHNAQTLPQKIGDDAKQAQKQVIALRQNLRGLITDDEESDARLYVMQKLGGRKGRRAFKGDNKTIATAHVNTGRELGNADRNKALAYDRLESATDGLAVATLRLAAAEDAEVPNAVAIAAARKAHADANRNLEKSFDGLMEAEKKYTYARGKHTATRIDVDQHAAANNGISRVAQGFDRGTSRVFDGINSKLIYMGRYLSAITSVGRFAGMALAALGAVNLVPLLASLAQTASALTLLPALATGAAAAIAAIAVGMSGVVAAFKAATKMTKDDGKEARAAAKQRESAAKQLEKAQRSAARTAENGAESIANAEKSASSAQKNAADQQKDLTRARKDAATQIKDLNRQLRGLSEDEEGASLAVEAARLRMAETMRSGTATSLDRRTANLGVREAIRNLDDVRYRNQQLRDEANEANRLGVEGSERVVNAKEAVANATEAAADAERNVTRAREDAAEANADAAQAIIDAQENVVEALQATGSATNEYNEAMEKLSPNARKFVEATRGLGDEWKALREETQDNLFEGLDASASKLAMGQLPVLRTGLAGIASEINGGLKGAINAFSSESAKLDFSTTLGNTTTATGILSRAMAPLSQAWMDITTVGSSFLPQIATGMANAARKFANYISDARKTGALKDSIQRGIDATKQWSRIIRDFFGGIRGVFAAVRDDGNGMADTLERNLRKFKDWTRSAEGKNKIADFFSKAREQWDRIMPVLSDIGNILVEKVIPAFEQWGQIIGPILAGIVTAIDALPGGISWVLTAFLGWRVIGPMLGGLRTATGFLSTSLTNTQRQMAAAGPWRVINGHFVTAGGQARAAGDRMTGMAGQMATGVAGVKNAGKSLVGFLGGWWGVGIMAAVAVMGYLQQAHAKAAAEADKQRVAEQELMNTLDEKSGAATKETRTKFAQQLYDDNILSQASSFGIEGESIVSAGMGDTAQINALDKRLLPLIREGLLREGGQGRYRMEAFTASGDITEDDIVKALAGDANSVDKYNAWEQSQSGKDVGALRLENLRDTLGDRGQSASRIAGGYNRNIGRLGLGGDAARLVADAANGKWEQDAAVDQQFRDQGMQIDRAINQNEIVVKYTNPDQLKPYEEKGYTVVYLDGNLARITGGGLAADGTSQLPGFAHRQGTNGNNAPSAPRPAGNAPINLSDPRYSGVDERPQSVDTPVDLSDPRYAGTDERPQSLGESTPDDAPSMDFDPAQFDDPAFADDGSFDVPGAVGQVPFVDYGPALGAFSTYGEQVSAIFNEKIKPALTEMIQLQEDFAAKMFTAAGNSAVSWKFFTDNTVLAGAAIDGQINGKILPGMETMKRVQDEMGNGFQFATGRMIESVNSLQSALNGLRESFIANIKYGAVPEWDSLEVYIRDDVKTISETHFKTLDKSLQDTRASFKTQVSGIAVEWSDIKRAIAEPINWIINSVINGGLKDAWNSVRSVVPDLPEWTVVTKPIEGYYRGGIMSGYSPGRDDRVIAVGGGEAVMRPEWVRAMGADYVNEANAAARGGGIAGVKAFANKFAGAYANGGIVDSMRDVVAERFPMLLQNGEPFSGLRFTDNGYHSKGMAADFSNGGNEGTVEMKQLAAWIAGNWQDKTIQLIHNPFGANIMDGYGVGDGYGSPGYGAATMEEHRNHVHWAIKEALDGRAANLPGIGMLLGGAARSARALEEKFNAPMKALRESMPDFGGSLFGQVPGKMFDQLVKSAGKVLGTTAGKFGSLDAGITPWDISAGVEQWHDNIVAALIREGWEPSERNILLTKKQMQTESGGDPNIVQKVIDVNSGGNEAVGPMQVTPGTFAAYRNPELPNDRTNVDASLSAALRWYRFKWGDDLGTMWGQGHGYDQGGVFENGTIGWNTSGKPEAVFTNEQWEKIDALIEALTSPDIYSRLTDKGIVSGGKFQAAPAELSEQTERIGTATDDLTTATNDLGEATEQLGEADPVPSRQQVYDEALNTEIEEPEKERRSPFQIALQDLGRAFARPDMLQRLTDPGYGDRLAQIARDRTAESDAAYTAGDKAKGDELSELPPEMGYDPGTQALLATMGTQQEQLEGWERSTRKSFEEYLKDNWKGMADSAVAGAIGGNTYQIGSIQTNSWTEAQRQLDRKTRAKSRANSRVGGR